MGFRGAGIVSAVGTLPESVRPASVDATENLDNILTTGVLPQLKATFRMPTEGERKILIEVRDRLARILLLGKLYSSVQKQPPRDV